MKKSKLISWGIYAIALIYLFIPIDIIPDIPLVGMLDDAIVLTIAKLFGERK